MLDQLRYILEINFGRLLPFNEAGLLSGIVFGSKKALSTDLYQALKQTGTLHIVVASGMNVVMLSGFLMGFLALFFKRKIALIPLVIMIWFYALITGFDPPVIRASIMASLTYLAQELGKPAQPSRILVLTGLLMLMINPGLISSVSFQLSFASTAGLIFIQPIIKKSKNKILQNESFSTTFAAQIATLPIVILNFGQYNFLSPLVNFLVLWTVPYLLSFGMIIAFLSFLFYPVAQLLAYLVYPIAKYFVIVVKLFSNIKILEFWVPKLGLGWGMGYYLVLGWWIWQRNKFEARNKS